MKNFFCHLLCLSVLSGCAAFGTKTVFNTPDVLPAIKRVALVTSKVGLPAGVVIKEVDTLFVKDLTKQLAAATGWQVQYLGEVEAFMAGMGDANNPLLNGVQYQAVVHAELGLAYYGIMGNVPRFNSTTRMQIIQLPSEKLLGENHFNTLMGNSYMAHPVLDVAVADGVAGMLRPWQKKLTQLRSSH